MSDRLERIEKYLAGEMTVDEKLHFEQEMVQDPDLQEMVSRVQILDKALDVAAENDLRSFLQKLEARKPETSGIIHRSKTRTLFRRLALAASILMLISVGLWYYSGQGSMSLSQYRDAHYLAYDYALLRGEYNQQKDFPKRLANGNTDKKETAQWFVSWLNSNPEDYEARFILADLYRNLHQIDKAKAELAIIMASASVLWGEKAEWNYVLLSADQVWDGLAESTLQKMISDPSHSYHRQANELHRMLKK